MTSTRPCAATRMRSVWRQPPSTHPLHTVLLDVRDKDAVSRTVTKVQAAAGRIDVLINNAGITKTAALEDMPAADVEAIMATNFFGPLWVTRAVLPYMRAQCSGCIVNLSSLSGLIGLPGDSIYAASKAALEIASEGLRHEVARFNIRVCVVEPGFFNTRMPEKMSNPETVDPRSPYALLTSYLVNRQAARTGEGDDPRRVAELLLNIAGQDAPAFRIPAGAQAERIAPHIAGLSPTERDELIPTINDTQWWSAGGEAPDC